MKPVVRPRSVSGVVGGSILAFIGLVAFIGAVWTPYDPLALNIMARMKPPSLAHPLGTDEFGRDVMSRLMAGAATSLGIAAMTTSLAVIFGGLLGVVMGFFRGWIDRVLSVVTDTLLAFPGILLALGFLAVVGANKTGIVVALGLAYTPAVVRIVRGTVLSLREKEYIEASEVIGNGSITTMIRHVIPNCLTPVLVLAAGMFGWVLLAESALSFLGIGVPPPAPTWGNMLATGRPYLEQAVWLGILPGLCISLTLLGVNLLGDALRDRFDPRSLR